MAEGLQISVETKKRLLEEKQKIDDRANRYIRRQIMYRRFILLFTIQIILYVPVPLAIGYFFGTLSLSNLTGILVSLLTITYAVSLNLFMVLEMRRRYKNLSKTVCLYTSISGAEALEKGNIAKGSFFAVKLFEFMKPFSEAEKIKLGHFKSTVKNLFLGDIENLHEQKSAVGKAILSNPTKRLDFSNNLYILADSLFSDSPSNIDGAITALRFFANESEKYSEPKTFLQKHKKVDMSTKVLSEIGKITLVPILLFVLWFISGYK